MLRNAVIPLARQLALVAFLILASCTPPSGARTASSVGNAFPPSADKPNILLIVVDDLGYSDLGIMGGEIATPNIDRLATDGLLMTNFYAGATCSPTRAMLLSGIDHHQAGVGTMMEHIAPNQRGQPGYEGYLNDRVVTLPELLQDAGYRTYAAGKWHLGMTPETSPSTRGFDHSFMLLNGGASHFDQSGLDARTDPAPYREDGKMVDLPEDFKYSTDFYTSRMIEYIEADRAEGAPFFAYLAYTAPHWPLQAPAKNTAKYAGVYDAGWQAIQEKRRARMVASGLIPASTVVHPIYTKKSAWQALSAEQQRYEARKMEIYAGMVDRLDQQIGEMISYLKRTGQYENTVIVFMSDNGAEGAPLYELDGFKGWMDSFDNSLANMGSKGSYVFYEERWAQVSMTPFRLYKGMASDGGVHVPAFITYGGAKVQDARHTSVTSVMDVAPTLLELAGVKQLNGQYGGRDMLAMQGKSWVPVLQGSAAQVRTASEGLGSELFNKRGYRRGNWKALHLHEPFGPGRWQLYDLSNDPGETKDLAATQPEVLEELMSSWERYAKANGVVLGNTPPDR
jgi:arylsulfatase A-like enzyme